MNASLMRLARLERELASMPRRDKLAIMELGPDATAGRTGASLGPLPKHQAYLFCAAQACDTGAFEPSRHVLTGVAEVTVGRGASRVIERQGPARSSTLALRFADPWMSSKHAVIAREGSGYVLRDCGSRNQSFVNGTAVTEHVLEDGDVLELGNVFFVFRKSILSGTGETDDALAGELGQTPPLVALSPPLARLFERISSAAPSSLSVFLGGETGTGKEVVARAIHDRSGRPGAFVAVNCAAIAQALVESELFGYKKGAFSGALENRPGLIRSADKGTLFLDEIGDMPLAAQAVLLRVLQEREVLAVGATQPVAVDIRVIAATHQDLAALVERGQFRADLQARLMGLTANLPPLRDRTEDLGLLFRALCRRHFPEGAKPSLSLASARALFACAWPFNIRELDRRIAGAAALAGEREIEPAHLLFEEFVAPPGTRPRAPTPSIIPVEDEGTAEQVAQLTPEDEDRKARLLSLLQEHDWNVSAVARVTGKARMQIQRWMIRYQLRR